MALPASGQITLNQVNVELGLSGTAQLGLGDTVTRDLFGVVSGQITMANGYGATAGPNFAAITSPTRITTGGSLPGACYLKDEGDGNGDVMFGGTLFSSTMKFTKFGTNNKISTWSSSGTPVSTNVPSPRYGSGQRAFTPAAMGGRFFVAATENWLGYSTGAAVAVYKMDGTNATPTLTAGWTQFFHDQTSTVAILMDPINRGNGMVLNTYTQNAAGYNNAWAFPFQVNAAGTSITMRGSFSFSSEPGYISGLYYDGRALIRSNSSDGKQNYVYTANFNTSTGAKSAGPTRSQPNSSQAAGRSMDGITQEIFCLSGDWFIVHRDDSGTDQIKISRMTFSGTTVTYSNTVSTGLGIGSVLRLSYKIGEADSSNSNRIYVANYASSDGIQTTPTEQVWEWTGSAISKIYEKTGSGLLNSIVGFTKNASNTGAQTLQYIANDNVFGQMVDSSAGNYQQQMPYYWSHK